MKTAPVISYRTGPGARYPDLSNLQKLMRDERAWVVRGTVWVPPGRSSHYRVISEGELVRSVLIEVRTVPGNHDLTCELSTIAGGANMGIWAVPPVGSQVVVALPDGSVSFTPTIVGVLAYGAPDRISEDKTIIVATGTVEITAPKIVLSSDPTTIVDAQDGVVVGRGIDPFTGTPYYALGNTSSIVKAEK